jgi:nucleotide-binding universal stress UspA family protein
LLYASLQKRREHMSAMTSAQGPFGDPAPSPTARPETILVVLQDHQDSVAAVPAAKLLARLEDAPVHFLYAGSQAADPKDVMRELGLTSDDLQGAVLNQVQQTAESIENAANTTPSPLVVTSARPTGDDIDAPLGILCDAVLSSTLSQVLIVPPNWNSETWQIRNILLAHDGSPSADAATSTAANLARRAGANVVALHVAARKSPQIAEVGSFPAPRYIDQPQHEWPTWANEFMQRMMALGASPSAVNFKLLVTGGQPGSEIADFARESHADMVVMSWHGRWEAERAGTLRVVIRRSECPVFLVCSGSI